MLSSLVQERDRIVAALIEPIRDCVIRRDTRHEIFHGCIDWHSAVHGHWALIAAARLTGDANLSDLVLRRLAPEAVAAEQAFLARNPSFELPYGRAWFLRLALEFERTFAGDMRLRAMADDVALSLRRYYATRAPDPASLSYDSASWALINLRAWAIHSQDAELTAFVDGLVARHFEPLTIPCTANTDRRANSFMALCSNRAWLVSLTLPPERFAAWLREFQADPRTFTPVSMPASSHLFGLNFSRSWGLWRLYRQTGDQGWLAAWRRHFEANYRDPAWWMGDYQRVGHWVAQFGMFATVPLFEPDYD
ncbi:MAG: DUF2891 family protein [Pseudomonadota bacterium]|nr:DUF2891 family protein [Pseudomonadota bacterium]